jgi:hypothetical protein
VAGKYILSANGSCNDNTAQCNITIYKNGSGIKEGYQSNNGTTIISVSAVVDMNGTTDYVELFMYNGGGTVISGNSRYTFFSGALIAPVSAIAGGWSNDGTQSYLSDSTDKVGIGTTSPWAKLSIDANNLGAAPSFAIGSSTATNFIVTNAGKVGIGTTTPSATLEVAGGGQVWIRQGAGGALPATAGTGLKIEYGSAGGVFETYDYTNSVAKNLIINSAGGSVGISTTSPPAKLTVGGSGLFTGDLSVGNAAAGSTVPGVRIYGQAVTANYGEMDFFKTTSGSNSAIIFVDNGSGVGSISYTDTATVYNTSSDRRIKENIDYTKLGLDTLMQLPVRQFSFIKDETHATTTGFIAQELYEIFPWAVSTNGDNGIDPLTGSSTPWSVDYGRITPLVVKAVQDLNFKLESAITSATSSTQIHIDEEGNVGIQNTAPSVALDVTGSIEYTGTITDVSDERLKENITDIEDPFSVLGVIGGKKFNMIGNEEKSVGFLAQEVQIALPDSVHIVDPENGYLGVSYLDFIPYLVEAANELNVRTHIIEDLASTTASTTPASAAFAEGFFVNVFNRITAWLADAANGITKIFVKEVITEKLCVSDGGGETCVTKGQLDTLLSGQAAAAASAPSSEETPPVPVAPEPQENPEAPTASPEASSTPQALEDAAPEIAPAPEVPVVETPAETQAAAPAPETTQTTPTNAGENAAVTPEAI